PWRLECGGIGGELVVGASARERVEGRVGGHHPGLDGCVRSLDPRRVEKAGVAPDESTAGEHELRQRLEPAGVDCARPIRDAPAAPAGRAYRGMRLVALELEERLEIRVRIAKTDT